VEYVQFDNPTAALAIAARIKKMLSLLTECPAIGPPAPEIGRGDMRKMSMERGHALIQTSPGAQPSPHFSQ
jgi:hypothetical protein